MSRLPAAARPDPVPMLDLKRQYESIKDEVNAAIERVLTSQHFIGGPEVDAFERESAEYLGVRASVGCASGTDALWLALQACGVEAGTSVITTPFSFFASVSSIVRCGATPVLADIDPATLNLDPAKVEKALKRARGQVRAMMPVHLYGQCADMDRFSQLAQEYGVAIVEDAAQAFGAAWKGRRLVRWARRLASASIPPRTSARTATAGASPPMTKRWLSMYAACETTVASDAISTTKLAGTAAWMRCRRRSCG